MGRIEIDLFTTLDLVAQAPGGPDEDTEDGFEFAGWQAPLMDDTVGELIQRGIAETDALLLGRKTYDAFAGYWPLQADDFASGIAGMFNRIPKYVATRGNPNLDWAGSSLIGPDIATSVGEIRDRHEKSVHVIGSIDFMQTLLSGAVVRSPQSDRLSDYARIGQEALRQRNRPLEPETRRTCGEHANGSRDPPS